MVAPATWAALVALVVIGEGIIWFGLPYTWEGLPQSWRYRSHFLLAVLAVLPLAAIPPVRAAVSSLLGGLRAVGPRGQWAIAITLGVAAAAMALVRITSAGQPLYPMLHDEHSYLLQAQHLAQLRLWMPEHPLEDFFDSFHILVEPVYASIYWPGTGLFNVWGVWLGLPHLAIPLALYAATVTLTCTIASKATDAAAGLLAGLIIAAQTHLAAFSTLVMPQMPTALLGAALLWAFLRWRSAAPNRRLAWVAVLGALAGWMAVTRPVDALAFALPVGFCVLLLSMRRGRDDGDAPRGRRTLAIVAIGALAASPFLALQAVLNHGTTGSVLHPPYIEYLNQFQPGTEFGAGEAGSAAQRVSDLPQKQELYEQFVVEELQRRRDKGAWWLFVRERLRMTARATLPSLWLLPLPLAGALVALRAYPRALPAGRAVDPILPRMALATIALFMLFYAANPFFLSHYALPLSIPMALLSATAIHAIGQVRRAGVKRFVLTLVTGTLAVGLALGVLHYRFARPFPWLTDQHDLKFKYEDLPGRLGGSALVLVRYTGSGEDASFHWEPVYNSGTAWPDDAGILWAHDLAGRRQEILAYYGRRQPDRRVILWDRSEGEMYDLGLVTQALADQEAGVVDRMIRDMPEARRQPVP